MSEELYARVLCDDLLAFAQHFFPLVNSEPYSPARHHEAIAALVGSMMEGIERNVVVTMPPRCLKSYFLSVALPAFLLGHNPAEQIICVSYGDSLIEEHAQKTRRIMESRAYAAIFPDTVLARKTNRELETTAGGKRFATTIGGTLTGHGANWFIIDDPINGINAYSEPIKKQVRDFFDQALTTRANNPKTGKTLIVMQRLAEDDLAGHVLAEGEHWKHLKLQARATEAVTIDLGRGRSYSVEPGDLLDPNRLDEEELRTREHRMGSAAFQTQFQQDPVPIDGTQIKREWLKRYTKVPTLDGGIVVQSWDTAVKTAVANDYSVCTTWLLKDGYSYLLDLWRGKVDFPALVHEVSRLYHLYHVNTLLIEDVGSGSSLIQHLRVNSPFNVVARKTTLGKRARVDAIAGMLESGRLLLPVDAIWLPEFEREVLAFPGGKHDDQVDSFTQYGMWVTERSSSSFFEVDWGESHAPTMEGIAQHLLNVRSMGRRW